MPLRRDPDDISPRALARARATGRGGRPGGGLEGDDVGRHRPVEIPPRPVFEVPLSLQGARWGPSRAAVHAMLAVALVVAGVFGVRVWRAASDDGIPVQGRSGDAPAGVSRGSSTLARASPTSSSTGPPTGSPAGSHSGSVPQAPAASAPGSVVVHVVGQVAKPGVYTMAAGARVGEAVTAAGGATHSADLAAVNLARVVVDGEQVVVPAPGEVARAGPPAVPGVGAKDPAGAAPGTGAVSLNTADLTALDTLPGVGPVLAQRILDWRTEHGRFTSVEELGEVSGIGDKLLAQLTPKVTL